MKIRKLLLFCFLLGNLNVFAQKDPIKIGEVDEKDVKTTKYDKFPDAEAIVLCHYGKAKIELSAQMKLVVEYTTRVKILTKAGYERANHTIYYHVNGSDRERVSDIKGYTYNYEAGKVVKTKLEKSSITDKMVGKQYGEVKFAMPNVKEGSVIEYTYEVRSDFWFDVPTWYFQSAVPVLWSEYRTSVPDMYVFSKFSQGYKEFAVSESTTSTGTITAPQGGGSMNYQINNNRWAMQDVPAFKNEPFIASPNDCIMKMELNMTAIKDMNGIRRMSMDSWDKITKTLLDDEKYGKYLNKNFPDKAFVASLVAGKDTPKDKAIAIYDYIKKNFKYNGKKGVQTKKSLQTVWEKKIGNNAEINLLLVNMLREGGVSAEPVVLSTREHGKVIPQFPLIDKFNYTVAYISVGGEEFLLDATDPLLVMGMLAYPALNGLGLLVKDNAPVLGDWVDLQVSKFTKTSKTTIANLSMTKDGTAKGEVSTRFGGYDAISMRRKNLKELSFVTEETEEEDEDEPQTATAENKEEKDKNKLTFKNLTDFDKPLDGVMNIETNESSQLNDDFIYFSPMMEFRMKENPLKSETRDFPIDYACATEHNFYMNFTIPEGYKIEELPKPLRIKWEDNSLKFEYVLSNTENKIQLVSKFILTRPIFLPQEYKQLRDLYAQIVSKQEEQIVLKKK